MRRICALFAVAALVSAPAVAASSSVCRFGGVGMMDCAERQAACSSLDLPTCCKTRSLAPLAAVRPAPRIDGATAAAQPALAGAGKGATPPLPLAPPGASRPTGPHRPPAFLIHRALLL